MMLENQKQQQTFEQNFVYEIISDSSLPSIDKLQNISPHIMNSTSTNQQQQTYKYWNPATIDDSANNSHAQMKTVDQLIGESEQ